MDDDDYYFPNRVEHAVSKLMNSTNKIAGCSKHLMYDYNLNSLIQMRLFGPNHSINTCMAWKKEYLHNHSHDPEKEFAEEPSFTNTFQEPLIQLDPYSTVIVSSHNMNTFSKKQFFISAVNNLGSQDIVINKNITKYIPQEIYNRYKKVFVNNSCSNDETDYDIVYMCGGLSIKWVPNDKKLGGSEQAVVNLSENLVKLNKSVIVYGEVPNMVLNGVVYKNWINFNFNKKYKTIILWRLFGIISTLAFNLNADNIIYDAHDNFSGQQLDMLLKYSNKFNKIMVKSEYHKQCFLERVNNTYDQDKIVVIPNGIRINEFMNVSSSDENIIRNPYRFCYCSCYTRGLNKIISIMWPIIYKYEPRAELHVYYGMDGVRDENFKNEMRTLLGQPGVMDHGRQPLNIIAREKHLSTFHFYITQTESEIDCISIRESLVSGCIPLLSNFGVFRERDGIHFDINNDKDYNMAAVQIIKLLKNPENIKQKRNEILQSKDIISWETVAQKWFEYL